MNDLLLFTNDDSRIQINLRASDLTATLTQLEMAELFDATKQKISLLLKNLFAEGALGPTATAKESSTVQIEDCREIQRPVNLYNFDTILAVGDRMLCPDARPA